MMQASEDRPDDLISSTAAARLLGVHTSTVCRWVLTGKLRGWRKGERYQVSQAEAMEMVQLVRVEVPKGPRTKAELERAHAQAMREIELMGRRGDK